MFVSFWDVTIAELACMRVWTFFQTENSLFFWTAFGDLIFYVWQKRSPNNHEKKLWSFVFQIVLLFKWNGLVVVYSCCCYCYYSCVIVILVFTSWRSLTWLSRLQPVSFHSSRTSQKTFLWCVLVAESCRPLHVWEREFLNISFLSELP